MKRKSRGEKMLEIVSGNKNKSNIDSISTVHSNASVPVSIPCPLLNVEPEPILLSVGNEIEEHDERLDILDFIKKFSCLDIVLLNMKSKNRKPIWEDIQLAFHSLTMVRISLQDLALILYISSEFYNLFWEVSSESQSHLYLLLEFKNANKQSQSQSQSYTNLSSSHKSRIDLFEAKLQHNISAIRDKSIFQHIMQTIPAKPNLSLTNSNNSNSSKSLVKLAKQNIEDKKVNLKQQLNALTALGTTSLMENLEIFAKTRGETLLTEKKLNDVFIHVLHVLKSLPDICNILRSHALMTKKSNMSMQDITEKLAIDMNLNLTASALYERIHVISNVTPEFLYIFPPDDIVKVETLRVNLNANFTEVRKKINEKIQAHQQSI